MMGRVIMGDWEGGGRGVEVEGGRMEVGGGWWRTRLSEGKRGVDGGVGGKSVLAARARRGRHVGHR
jgi:hypothetical protein